jgi:hypothetical protein
MLIIGNEHPDIDSVAWIDESSVNITDYQILLVDSSTLPEIFSANILSAIRESIKELLANGYPIVFILPRNNFTKNWGLVIPGGITIRSEQGKTIDFYEHDEIMNFYKNFIDQHEIVISNSKADSTFRGKTVPVTVLMSNNINKPCSLKYENLYLLHPPAMHLHEKAIASLVDYFAPDTNNEKIGKPEWVLSYELKELGLQAIDDEVSEINKQIAELTEKKDGIAITRQKKAKWSDLLTQQGKVLELRLKEALELLGVEKVLHEPNGSNGPDLVIDHKTLLFTVEVEGTKGSIKLKKARQLLHWIADAPSDHKGILIGNPHYEHDPKDRPPGNKKMFVDEVEVLAQKRNFALITSNDIFKLVCKKNSWPGYRHRWNTQ